jgi:uncharacterized membrane protein
MTILLILVLLAGPYLVLPLLGRIWQAANLPEDLRGRLGLTLVFLMTGIGHFVQTRPMAEMLPPWVPGRVEIVYFSGVVELVAAVTILIPGLSRLTGMSLFLFLLLVFPANVYSAIYQTGIGAHPAGPWYLVVRGPLQVLLLWWVYWFAIRSGERPN